jgi:DNA polymerase elongation subunit (family B)
MAIRRLFFDIETSPNIGFFWQPGHKISIGHENIIHERAIICICYKWSDQNKVYHLQWDTKQSDKKMLIDFIKVANQADELVGHNGDNFDLKWIRTRCYFYDIDMMPSFKTIDTLKEARKGFRFNSNRLDYISKFGGSTGKIGTSFSLWKDIVLKKCDKSLRYMIKYCKKDVIELETVFNKMNKYIKPKTSIADKIGDCPECGHTEMKFNGDRVSARLGQAVQLQCKNCGKCHTISRFQYEKAN